MSWILRWSRRSALMARASPTSADVLEKGVAIIEDDVTGPIAKGVTRPVFSRDSRRLGYAIETFAKRGAIVLDGVVGREWMAAPNDIVFSPDGRRVMASASWKEGGFLAKRSVCAVIADDQIVAQEEALDCSLWPVFSADGQHVAWWMQRSKEASQMFVDGAPIGDPTSLSEPRFTPTGAVVYASRSNKGATIAIDGRPGPKALELMNQRCTLPRELRGLEQQYRLAPIGEHVAWAGVFDPAGFPTTVVGSDPGWQRPVLDDRVGPAYDQVFSWGFDESGTAWWMAQRGQSILRVSAAA